MAGWGNSFWGTDAWGNPMTELGVNFPHAVAFETAVGKTVRWCRVYAQTEAYANSGDWADAFTADARGQKVILSFKSSFTWAQVASGSDDARLTSIANGVMAHTTNPGIIVFNHEPENDGGITANFIPAAAHVRAVMGPLMPGWRFGQCLILDTFRTGSGRHPDDWVDTGSDVLLVDGYNWRDADTFGGGWADPGVSDRTPVSIYGTNINAPTYAANLGMTFGFGEIGCSREQADSSGLERTAWWDSFADYTLALPTGTVEMICHFEKNTSAVTPGDGGVVNWAIRSEPASAAQFARLAAATISGTSNTTTGLRIADGETYTFDPYASTTLTVNVDYTNTTQPANNIIVEGTLVMRPASASVVHTIQFVGIDTTQYVGGTIADHMNPPTTDPGIWVVMDGVLDIEGTERVAWNRTGTDTTWRVGDEVMSVPWNGSQQTVDLTTTAVFTPGVTGVGTYVTCDGVTQRQEICNLTRNVIIKGALNAESHLMMMSTQPQSIKYATLQYMGPRDLTVQNANNRDAQGLILGRWALHFHIMGDGSRGSEVTGVVVRDARGRAYVTHASHGVYYYDCLSWKQPNGGFWYDNVQDGSVNPNPVDAPGDLTYEHCGCVVYGRFTLDTVLFNGRNHIFDCFVAGQGQSSASGSGATGVYDWSNQAFVGSGGSSGEGEAGDVWDWHDNVAHNVGVKGLSIWQNEHNQHLIDGATIFKVKWKNNPPNGTSVGAIDVGAYKNDYDMIDSTFDDAAASEAASSNFTGFLSTEGIKNMPGQNWIRCHFMSTWLGMHVQPSSGPTRFIDSTFHDFVHCEDPTGSNPANHRDHDFIRCNIGPPSMDPTGAVLDIESLLTLTEYRFQDVNGNAWRLVHPTFFPTPPYTFATIAPFALYIVTAALDTWVSGVSHSQTLTAALGTGTYGTAVSTWAVATGTLPTGLTLSNAGVLSGTTTQTGTFPLTLRVTDNRNFPADRALSLVVSGSSPLQITTSSLPGGFIGTSYSQTLVSTGGSGTKTWTLASGSLPAGIGLSSAGVISGTPTTAGLSNFTVRVTDTASNTATKPLSINVVNLNPVITTTSPLAGGGVGIAYSQTLQATGGSTPYTWTVVSGSLPTGLSLATSGVISGTPTVAQIASFTVRCTDSAAHATDKAFTLTTANTVVFVAADPPDGHVHAKYSYTFVASLGTPPYTFAAGNPAEVPPGLTVDEDGVLSGRPTTEGFYPFRITVFDSLSVQGIADVSMTIGASLKVPRRGMTMRGASKYVSTN